MEQHCQFCVKKAWDSSDQAPEPKILRDLNSRLSGAGRLPLFPELGRPCEDRWNLAKPPAEPCGLLSWACPRHKCRDPNTLKPTEEQLDSVPTPENHKKPQASPGERNPAPQPATDRFATRSLSSRKK